MLRLSLLNSFARGYEKSKGSKILVSAFEAFAFLLQEGMT